MSVIQKYKMLPTLTRQVRLISTQNLVLSPNKPGVIDEAGRASHQKESKKEDEYFYKMQREQLKDMKNHLSNEISFHKEQIKKHLEAIERHKQRVGQLDTKF